MTLLAIGQRPAPAVEPDLVQAPDGFSGSSGSVGVAFGGDNAAGNLIVVGVWIEHSSATITSVTDTQGNTYNAALGYSGSWASGRMRIYYAENIASGANTVTVAISEGAARVNAHIAEFSGCATSSALDVVGTSVGGSDDPSSDSATPSQNNTLIYGFVANDGGDATPAGGLASASTYVFNKYTQAAWRVQPTAASTNVSFTTVSTNEGICQMAAFKPA